MPIAYSSGTNTITVTGYSEATPCNFTDIYNADVAGSWGKVTRQCTNQFCSAAQINVGDGSITTYFADENVSVIFTDFAPNSTYMYFVIRNNAYVRFGKQVSGTRTRNGCVFRMLNTTGSNYAIFGNFVDQPNQYGNLKLFSCLLIGMKTTYPGNWGAWYLNQVIAYNTIFSGCSINYIKDIDIQNVYVNGAGFGLTRVNDTTPTINNCRFHDITPYDAIYFDANSGNMTAKDCEVKNSTYDFAILNESGANGLYAVNVTVDRAWHFRYSVAGATKCYRQYEFDLKLVDSAGSGISTTKVKIWDKDDALGVNTTTNTSGVLAIQTLSYGYYYAAGGDTPVMKTPHEIRIYKYGKSMLSSKSSIEAKTDWALTMLTDDHITQTTEATVAAYTGITINHTAETITISENHTLDEIYDYCQYDMIAATKQLDQTMHTADGVNFVSEYSFVVNTGITVTATDQKLSMITGETYTLTGTAQFTGIIATTTTTRIPVKLSNIVDGSRYWVGKESDGSKIFEGTQSGSGVATGYYEHTANTNIDIRVRKSSASVKYKPWIGEGTLIAEAFSLRIRQIQDGIIT